jgi:hypothetical protein
MESKTKIIMTRKGEWMNRARAYNVLIDEQKTGIVKNDSSEEYAVAPGAHTVRCGLMWYSSPSITVNLKEGEIAYLRVKNGMKYYLPLFILMVVGVLLNLVWSGRPAERPDWVIYVQLGLLLPALLYIMYFITLGRKKYLVIEQDKDNFFA